MTGEQLGKVLALEGEINETRSTLLAGKVFGERKEHLQQHLLQLNRQLLELEDAAKPQPPAPNPEILKLGPDEAGKRAAAIRARPEYWRPDSVLKDGEPVITREAHEALVREHSELIARAEAPTASGGTP